MHVNTIKLSGYSFVDIDYNNGLVLKTHKDTKVYIEDNILYVTDPIQNSNSFNNCNYNFCNNINGIRFSNNNGNYNNFNNGISFNNNGNGISFSNNGNCYSNGISKEECNTLHELKCTLDIKNISSKGAISTVFKNINVNEICIISLEGSGKLNFKQSLTFNNLNCQLTGSGDIILNGNINTATITLTGSGDISMNCDIQHANVILSGSGGIDLNGTLKNATLILTGSGDINGFTISENASITLTGSGDIKGKKSSQATINKSKNGSGSIKIR